MFNTYGTTISICLDISWVEYVPQRTVFVSISLSFMCRGLEYVLVYPPVL